MFYVDTVDGNVIADTSTEAASEYPSSLVMAMLSAIKRQMITFAIRVG